jgi:O-antigen/teichoic acid export membrane protein
VGLGTGVADQAVLSLATFGVGIGAARSLSPTDFGAFALALAAYWICLGVSRALNSEPFVVRFSGTESNGGRLEAQATGASVVTGLALGALVIAGAFLAINGSIRWSFVAIAASLPAMLLQDSLRFLAFAGGRGSVALISDTAWAIALGFALAGLSVSGVSAAWLYVTAWGASSIVGVAVAIAILKIWPRPRAAIHWWSSQRDLALRYLAEFTAQSGAGQISIYMIGAIAGVASAGALRGAQVLMGPITVLFLGITTFAVPEAVRRQRTSPRALRSLARMVSGTLGMVALVWCAVLLSIPESIGSRLLGASWKGSSATILGVGLGTAAYGFATGAFVGLRAYAAAGRSLRIRMLFAPITLACAGIGATVDGARGGALGLAAAATLGVGIWWAQFGAEARAQDDSGMAKALGERPTVSVLATCSSAPAAKGPEFPGAATGDPLS